MMRNLSSFRDSSGFVFVNGGKVYRFISLGFRPIFEEFEKSDLFARLTRRGWLIKYQDAHQKLLNTEMEPGSRIIEPEQLEVISYPFEWSFSQLREAALLTLDICLESLKDGYILKDASAYNIQLFRGKSVFIDSLSFVQYEAGQNWAAYRQFLYHFLNPLMLMAKVDPSLNSLLRIYLDGIPSRLTSHLLPFRVRLNPIVFINVLMHAYLEKKYENQTKIKKAVIAQKSLFNMLEALKQYILTLEIKPVKTEWGNYYEQTNYEESSFEEKSLHVIELLREIGPTFDRVLDLGANDGTFSRKISSMSKIVISADVDPAAVERNFILNRKLGLDNIYPLRIDFTNPSPNLGWNCSERDSFFKRAHSDVVVCLAFIHHMVIGQNISFEMIATSLASLGKFLIIEFVGEDDSQVIRLLSTRKLNHIYNREIFEKTFSQYFYMEKKIEIGGTKRTLYVMKRKVYASIQSTASILHE